MRPVVGIDVNVSNEHVGRIERLGFEVIAITGHEPDEEWIGRCLDAGAIALISNDTDIATILDRWDIMDVPVFSHPKPLMKWFGKKYGNR